MDDGSVAVVSKNKVNYIYDRFQKPTKSDTSDRYNEYKIAILYVYQAEGDLLKEKFKQSSHSRKRLEQKLEQSKIDREVKDFDYEDF